MSDKECQTTIRNVCLYSQIRFLGVLCLSSELCAHRTQVQPHRKRVVCPRVLECNYCFVLNEHFIQTGPIASLS
jgi:hypothetical protein